MKKRAEVDAKKQADIDANRQKMKAEAAKKAEEQAKKPSADELYGNVPLNKEFVREQKPAFASIKAAQPKPTQSQAAQSEQEAGSAPSSSAGGEA